jgi:hypothetical protein
MSWRCLLHRLRRLLLDLVVFQFRTSCGLHLLLLLLLYGDGLRLMRRLDHASACCLREKLHGSALLVGRLRTAGGLHRNRDLALCRGIVRLLLRVGLRRVSLRRTLCLRRIRCLRRVRGLGVMLHVRLDLFSGRSGQGLRRSRHAVKSCGAVAMETHAMDGEGGDE